MRDGVRRLRAGLWAVAAFGVVPGLSAAVITMPRAYASTAQAAGQAAPQSATALGQASAAGAVTGQTAALAAQQSSVYVPSGAGTVTTTVPALQLSDRQGTAPLGPLGPLDPADLLVIAPQPLPSAAVAAIGKLTGVSATNLLDAARIKLNGNWVAMLGVDPTTFREFAAGPTARSTVLWQNVADGGIAISYLMGQQENLPLGGTVSVAGAQTEQLQVAGFGTVGISGVDAVVSDPVARSLGIPAGNALVISAPQARLSTVMQEIAQVLPKGASVAPLVAQAAERGLPAAAGSAGAISITAGDGQGLTATQTAAFLTAALSRVGLPYVWGGDGPAVFDCSGLVQWSMRQAGIVMPRVAADQAQTGPQIPIADLQPGDLLFYHTDPTAPTYISHVAIYIGGGRMLQAPEPGEDVQVVPADFGAGFAGAVRVYPRVAAAVAGNIAG
ncbi:MAG TPA: C40 family peptidase [Streptosporangiaceae bacterium]|nr:C40 family peptidase [Streptosporangiaceae bacterium]